MATSYGAAVGGAGRLWPGARLEGCRWIRRPDRDHAGDGGGSVGRLVLEPFASTGWFWAAGWCEGTAPWRSGRGCCRKSPRVQSASGARSPGSSRPLCSGPGGDPGASRKESNYLSPWHQGRWYWMLRWPTCVIVSARDDAAGGLSLFMLKPGVAGVSWTTYRTQDCAPLGGGPRPR